MVRHICWTYLGNSIHCTYENFELVQKRRPNVHLVGKDMLRRWHNTRDVCRSFQTWYFSNWNRRLFHDGREGVDRFLNAKRQLTCFSHFQFAWSYNPSPKLSTGRVWKMNTRTNQIDLGAGWGLRPFFRMKRLSSLDKSDASWQHRRQSSSHQENFQH